MTRLMGDAIADNASSLGSIAGLQLVAGYVTGTSDIQWTAADWALYPSLPHVTIDQGYESPAVTTATVRDVETGAWAADAATVSLSSWTAARPTIYCDQSTLPTILQLGWQGDLWLAIIGWAVGDTLPATPGCTVVAVQYDDDVNDEYDLSYVLDPTWPEADMAGATQLQSIGWCYKCDCMVGIPAATTSPCAAGGNHDLSQSYTYWLGTDATVIASSS
jgi:hypothetical protein